MTNFRLLPLVILATTSLFVLRGLAFVSDGRLNVFGSGQAVAQQAERDDDDPEMAAPAAESAKPKDKGEELAKADGEISIPEFSQREIQTLIQSGISESEVQLLLRLRERRKNLDSKERQLELRESMLKAMESSLQSKLNTLEKSPQFSGLDANGKPVNPNQQVQQMVTVYEAMKPKDAARILSRLDIPVLTSLAKAMKPRKMSAIMAQMDSEAAEKLTLALVGASSGTGNLSALPQVGSSGLSQ